MVVSWCDGVVVVVLCGGVVALWCAGVVVWCGDVVVWWCCDTVLLLLLFCCPGGVARVPVAASVATDAVDAETPAVRYGLFCYCSCCSCCCCFAAVLLPFLLLSLP